MVLSRREKLLLVGLLALGGLGAFFRGVHQPLFARRASAMELSEQARAELKKDQSRLVREGDLPSRKQAVAARAKVVDAWVPGKSSAALFIWYLSQAEMRSGARIKGITVGDRQVVTASPQPGVQPGAAGQAAPQQKQQEPKAGATAQPGAGAPAAPQQPQGAQAGATAQPGAAVQPGAAAQAGTAGPGPTLAVIRLSLQVDARFAEHLLFNQALEEMPLFLNTDALSLVPGAQAAQADMDRVAKLMQEGNAGLAAQILSTSPPLDGTYQINLFFKADKAGPTTETMQFPEQAGRMDPFVMNGVDEFIRMLSEHYTNQDRQTQPGAPEPGPSPQQGPVPRSGQMG